MQQRAYAIKRPEPLRKWNFQKAFLSHIRDYKVVPLLVFRNDQIAAIVAGTRQKEIE